MKLKSAITKGTPKRVVDALGSTEFASAFFFQVCEEVLGAEDAASRPAEYYVQDPDVTICTGPFGIETRLTGVSRGNRKAAQFHKAIRVLHLLVKETVRDALRQEYTEGLVQIQVFTVIMIDGDIETAPGSGQYSNTLESEAEWVSSEPEVAKPQDVEISL